MASSGKQKRASEGAVASASTSGSKRLRKSSVCEDEDSRASCSKSLSLPPMPKIYNSSHGSNKPAELFRKDLISAMKMADSEPLDADDYWPIADSWKQEWERGVQVPVNPDRLPMPSVRLVRDKKKKARAGDFRLPTGRFLRLTHDKFFSNDLHMLTNVTAQAEKMCRYDLDSLDVQWLQVFNEERREHGLSPVQELEMELIMEDLETQCYENLQREIKTEQGLGIEYDEDVICDVCRSPDSEEGNEMVFCDACDLCVHQACYGITSIPEGSWLCRTCALGIRPPCLLCPNLGGAMKCTRSGQKWAHVSCALWIPEVSIGCVERMEPITKISQIPASRWTLTCCLCRQRTGACIQCSVKTCKRAYHVTCAFENSLEMKAIIDENPDEGVKLRSFCAKHSRKKDLQPSSESDGEGDRAEPKEGHSGRREIEMTSEEKDGVRLAKIQAIEAEFYKHVNTKDTMETLSADPVLVDFIFMYWKLKRKANHDKPLLTPRHEETDRLDKLQENNLYSRMKMFVHLRQDLERVRNLCYMVTRREKIAKSFLKIRRDVFEQQVKIVNDESASQLSEQEVQAVRLAGQSDHIYDRLCSEDPHAPTPSLRLIISALEGQEVDDLYNQSKPERKLFTPGRLPNPYAKHYINGLRSRRSSAWNGESTDETSKDASVSGTDECATAREKANESMSEQLEQVSPLPTKCQQNGDVSTLAEDSGANSQDSTVEESERIVRTEGDVDKSLSTKKRLRKRLALCGEVWKSEVNAEVRMSEANAEDERQGSEKVASGCGMKGVDETEAEVRYEKDSGSEKEAAQVRTTRSSTHRRLQVLDGETQADKKPETAPDENIAKQQNRRNTPATTPACPALNGPSSLGGYKIPKKSRTQNGTVEDRRGSLPVSPLHEVPSHRYSATDSYSGTRGRHWRRNGNFETQKWSKDATRDNPTLCSDVPQRWKADANFGAISAWSAKENGSRYSMRFRSKCSKES